MPPLHAYTRRKTLTVVGGAIFVGLPGRKMGRFSRHRLHGQGKGCLKRLPGSVRPGKLRVAGVAGLATPIHIVLAAAMTELDQPEIASCGVMLPDAITAAATG